MPLKLIANSTGTNNLKLRNVNNSGRLFSYIASSNQIVSNGLTLNIDANDPSSYNGSGTTWYDISGNSANITLVGAPTYTSGTPSYFTFSGQYGTGAKADVIPSGSYTKMAWFYLNSYASNNNIVSGQSGGHFLFMASQNKIYSGHANWGNYLAYPSSGSISLSTWYNVALTFSTTNGMTLYINGALDSTYTASKAAHAGNGTVEIAAFGGSNLLLGRVAEALCYNRELSSGEILTNYNTHKSRYGL